MDRKKSTGYSSDIPVNFVTLLASFVLLVAISVEILSGNNVTFTYNYLITQFVICIIFIIYALIRLIYADNAPWKIFVAILFLIASIPYLNILDWAGISLTRQWSMAIGLIPMIRAFFAMLVLIHWMTTDRNKHLLMAYVFTVIVFTYLSALIFYDYEILVNSKLTSFGNALWWSGMSFSTVGAEIFPMTTIGKILAVMLPIMGMLMLPIFTSYMIILYQKSQHKKS